MFIAYTYWRFRRFESKPAATRVDAARELFAALPKVTSCATAIAVQDPQDGSWMTYGKDIRSVQRHEVDAG